MPELRGEMCKRCVLSTVVPQTTLAPSGICNVCREYDENKAPYESYFKTEKELEALLHHARRGDSRHDVLLMYSGGKDSTYVLYRLVKDLKLRVLAVTFDNGYIPPGCFDNIAGVCGQLGVDSLVVSVAKEKMDEAFQAGLKAQG